MTGENSGVRIRYSFISENTANEKFIESKPPAEPATYVLLTNCLKESVLKK